MTSKTTALLALLLALTSSGYSDNTWTLDPEVQDKCLNVLREGMQSDEFWPSMHAAEGLTVAGHGSEVQSHLAPKLDIEKDDQLRCGLARELIRSGDLAKSGVMMQILQGEDPHGHVHAAESLYKVGWEGSAEPLQKAFLETDDIRLKLMAAAALAKHNKDGSGKEAYAFLREHLGTEPDPEIFRLSAWVLGRIGEDGDRDLIRSRLKDADDPLVHAFLENALASLNDPAGQTALLRNLKSNDPAIRTYAAVFAGETGTVEAAPALILLLDDENLDMRIRAAQALLTLNQSLSVNEKK